MRAFLTAAALLFVAATPAHAQSTGAVQSILVCLTEEQHQFPPNRVAVIWNAREATRERTPHMITFTDGGPKFDPSNYAPPSPEAASGWAPTIAALREAAIQRRRVSIQHVGEEIFTITVLWSEPC